MGFWNDLTDASLRSRRAPVFSCAHYLQAPATQAKQMPTSKYNIFII